MTHERIAQLEPCWNCKGEPTLVKGITFFGKTSFQYVCEFCNRKSTSTREIEREAALIWNRSAKAIISRRKCSKVSL